jgi:mannosyl-3-phosphoglycerate phosphatase family protein
MRATFRVLISNLEGTLLDGETPARLEALHALRELHEREIPVVLCTSRTFEQTVVIREQLGIAGPFIVENGGAIYFPRGYFALTDVQSERKGDYQRISLGLPYAQTTLYLALLKKLVPGPIKGFSDMSLEEIAREGGLSPEEAARARQREFDEPFKIAKDTKAVLERLERTVKGSALSVSCGPRFFHLGCGSDPVRAVALLRKLYQDCYGPVTLAGVGNHPSDLPMLSAVDTPLIVASSGGRPGSELSQRLPKASKTRKSGSAGWNEVVSGMLKDWDRSHVA